MLLNCDLGESYGSWTMGHDASVMPHIDQASIACGFHAGDPLTMRRTLALAGEHGVAIGAHPAYPDLVGFGRRSMALGSEELIATLHYQIAALDGMARSQGLTLSYVKPHGALYHDMMGSTAVRAAVLQAVASYASGGQPLALMLQATAHAAEHRAQAQAAAVPLLFEAFADRCYADDGSLLPRSRPGAVHARERMLAQVAQLQRDGAVTTHGGNVLPLHFDTVCVHGDNPEGVAAIAAIRALLQGG
ncbi:MAG: 5-oxoprolinase subunit PxpA [Haliea sp.]|nr:5-oxoprolinase subunit PxpA [Haliea sp.]